MHNAASDRPAGTVAQALARGRLGIPAMVSFVGASAAPLMVLAALTTTAWQVTGFVAMPIVFIVIGAVLAVFAVGYTTMARSITNAGALYSYITHGLGRPAGVSAAFVALVAYNGLQIGLYGVFGALASQLIPAVPWWGFALAAWIVTAALGLARVDFNSTVLLVLLGLEFGIVAVADVAMLIHPHGGTVSAAALDPTALASPALGAAIVVVATSFVGIEAPTVYAEEARDPRRSVPIATYLGIGLVTVFYAVSSWALTVHFGPGEIVASASNAGPDLLFNAIGDTVGAPVSILARALLVTSIFAGLVAFHNTCNRYTFALGREGIVPRALGRTVRTSGAPKAGSWLQTGTAGVVLLVFALAGADPMTAVFFPLGTGGGLGVLLLLATASVAILAFFTRNPQHYGPWQVRILPAVAFIGLTTGAVLALTNMDTLLGVDPSSPLVWVIPLVYAAAVAAGLGWAVRLKSHNPQAYRALGRGAHADTRGPIQSKSSYVVSDR